MFTRIDLPASFLPNLTLYSLPDPEIVSLTPSIFSPFASRTSIWSVVNLLTFFENFTLISSSATTDTSAISGAVLSAVTEIVTLSSSNLLPHSSFISFPSASLVLTLNEVSPSGIALSFLYLYRHYRTIHIQLKLISSFLTKFLAFSVSFSSYLVNVSVSVKLNAVQAEKVCENVRWLILLQVY